MKSNNFLVVFFLTVSISVFSQSKGYNYVDINTEALSVPMSYLYGNSPSQYTQS